MGIDKYPLDRMRDKGIELSFDCPYCLGHRIEMINPDGQDFWKGIRCPKCKTLIVLDSLSVVTVREALRSRAGAPA